MRGRSVLDLRDHQINDVLTEIAQQLGTDFDDDLVYGGEDGATAGMRTARGTWIRLQHRPPGGDIPPRWAAEETAATLTGVRKPGWHRAVVLDDPQRGVQWRADELDCIDSPGMGGVLGLTALPDAPETWWRHLHQSLTALADQHSDRIALDQATVDRRIAAAFGDTGIDTTVTEWTCAHGDLHWGNLTQDCHLLDWEGWGIAPRGLDAATLWGMALPHTDIAERIQRELAADLDTHTGRIMQLMWCAAAVHAHAQRGDLDDFARPAHTHTQQLLATLRGWE